MKTHRFSVTAVFGSVCCVLFAAAVAVGAERVDTIDGRKFEGRIRSLDNESLSILRANDKVEEVALDEISRITFDNQQLTQDKKFPCLVQSFMGDSVYAENVLASVAEQDDKPRFRLSCSSLIAGTMSADVDKLLTIVFAPEGTDCADILNQCAEEGYSHSGQDMLIARKTATSNLQSVKGALKSIGEDKITFNYNDKDRRIDRSKVPAIFLAKLASSNRRPACSIRLVDGSVLRVTSVRVEGEELTVISPVFGELKVPRDKIASISFESDRVTDMVGLEPVEVKEHGFFDVVFNYRKNRSVSGKALRLDGKVYDSGLGMHSYSEITWNIDKKYARFLATVGIDDAVRPNGNVNVTVLADGKEVLGPVKITGRDKPVDVNIEVNKVLKLTIRVDFGDDKLDIFDHLNIANPRLVE